MTECTVLVQLTVTSFDRFLEGFETRGLALRRRHGSRGARVLRDAGATDRVMLLFDWEHDAFRGFLADPEVRASMRAGGAVGPPEITFLDAPLTLPA